MTNLRYRFYNQHPSLGFHGLWKPSLLVTLNALRLAIGHDRDRPDHRRRAGRGIGKAVRGNEK
jgi:hypothetical protein